MALLKRAPARSLDANPYFQFPFFGMVDGKLSNVTGHVFPGLALQDVADAGLILGPENRWTRKFARGQPTAKSWIVVAESCLKGRVSWHRHRLPQIQQNPKL